MNPRATKLLQTLQQDIQHALEDVVLGQNLHAGLPGQIKRTVNSILLRNNIRQSTIQVQQQGTGFVVSVTLPPQGPIVQQVRLRFG